MKIFLQQLKLEQKISQGCLPNCGCVTLDGEKIPFVLKVMAIGLEAQWLGIRLRGLIKEYGQKGILHISGFVDTDGNEMESLTLTVIAEDKVEPRLQDQEHERIALCAAEEGIVLLKNAKESLPMKKGEVLNFFGRGLSEFRVCAVGAGKINPRYTCGLRQAIQQSTYFTLNEELDAYWSK